MTLYPIEIKKTATPGNAGIKNIRALSKFSKKIGTGAVLCMRREAIPLAENLISFPLWEI
jgi:hypothetical protein